ncbi:hypothetical protein [Roseateles oligotrophus]|uniref:Alpha/beta hydrolase n=1 Tax=Roseateles oligotrophus TaxID=1769250 RepID=A0ABT2YAD2_9BURK|nr:hypothetical protein [Roseateles oligotrophus]MCV2366542.1 hypothetical protein [Roseateles oligotrophus]
MRTKLNAHPQSSRRHMLADIEQIGATAKAADALPPNHQVPGLALRASKPGFDIPADYVKRQYPQAREIWIEAGHKLQWEAPADVVAATRSLLTAKPARQAGL